MGYVSAKLLELVVISESRAVVTQKVEQPTTEVKDPGLHVTVCEVVVALTLLRGPINGLHKPTSQKLV